MTPRRSESHESVLEHREHQLVRGLDLLLRGPPLGVQGSGRHVRFVPKRIRMVHGSTRKQWVSGQEMRHQRVSDGSCDLISLKIHENPVETTRALKSGQVFKSETTGCSVCFVNITKNRNDVSSHNSTHLDDAPGEGSKCFLTPTCIYGRSDCLMTGGLKVL